MKLLGERKVAGVVTGGVVVPVSSLSVSSGLVDPKATVEPGPATP